MRSALAYSTAQAIYGDEWLKRSPVMVSSFSIRLTMCISFGRLLRRSFMWKHIDHSIPECLSGWFLSTLENNPSISSGRQFCQCIWGTSFRTTGVGVPWICALFFIHAPFSLPVLLGCSLDRAAWEFMAGSAFGYDAVPDCLLFDWDSDQATFHPMSYAQATRCFAVFSRNMG